MYTFPAEAKLVHPSHLQGDERWARRRPAWRESELALAWPPELLEAFSLRMARHGMSICRTLMMCDRSYALQQLVHAQDMLDDVLRQLAMQMLRHHGSVRSSTDTLQ